MGIQVWDGINRSNRTEYPADVNQHRVVSYESARGLEGWFVVGLELDEFVVYKLRNPYIVDEHAKPIGSQLSLSMQSGPEWVTELVNEWILIALSRAIDTVVITLTNRNSNLSRSILRIAAECSDYVEVIGA